LPYVNPFVLEIIDNILAFLRDFERTAQKFKIAAVNPKMLRKRFFQFQISKTAILKIKKFAVLFDSK
jgi:flagellar assembly factor FliW